MGPGDRLFWVFLRQVWRNWANALIIVEADTVVQWQRQGFKWFWRTTPHDDYFNKDLFELLKGLTEGKVKGVKAVPKDNLVIAASGYSNPDSIANVDSDRVRAFLIGRALLESKDPESLSREFIQAAAKPDNLARAALDLLRDTPRRARIKSRLAEITASLGAPGASHRAAKAIVDTLDRAKSATLRAIEKQ